MKESAPYFKQFPDRWLGSMRVRAMSLEQRGVYADMLQISWRDIGIEESEIDMVARFIGTDSNTVIGILKLCYKCVNGVWENDLQEKLRAEKERLFKAKSEGGKKGAKIKYSSQKPRIPKGKPKDTLGNREGEGEGEGEGEKNRELKDKPLSPIPKQSDDIFTLWNEQKHLIHHRVFDDKTKLKVKVALKTYTPGEISDAICNYNRVLSEPETYFFQYKWTLAEFMARGLAKFLNEAEPLTNFLIDKEPEEPNPYRPL